MPKPPTAPAHDDPRSASTAWVGAIGGLILVLLILGLQLVFHRWVDAEAESKRSRAGEERLAALAAAQAAQLADYAVVDAEQGVLRMPIAAAMARIVAIHGGEREQP